jgi:hypothetical protein
MRELEFRVFYEDVNSKQIKTKNVFSGEEFSIKELRKLARSCGNKDEFSGRLQQKLSYRYWGRCEHEVVITGWPDGNTNRKVGIFEQIMLNWPIIFNYIWSTVNEDICSE